MFVDQIEKLIFGIHIDQRKKMENNPLVGLKPKAFRSKSLFTTNDGSPTIAAFTTIIETFMNNYKSEELQDIIHEFLGKWPHNIDIFSMAKGAAQAIESYHYEYIHNKPMSKDIKKYQDEVYANLNLKDEKYKIMIPASTELKSFNYESLDDAIKKMRKMDLQSVVQIAGSFRIEKKCIEKYLTMKSQGLAKMALINKIKAEIVKVQS